MNVGDIQLNEQPVITRADIYAIEKRMLQMPQVEIPVRHYFSRNVCAREITIPKGTRLIGRVHKYENLNILSKGEMSVSTENGFERIKAPFTVVSPPGTKRIAIAHEDCVWTTILGTALTDPEAIELEFTAVDEQEYLQFRQQLIVEA